MKYGYMFYQKPLLHEMKTRPVNLGDPIQSYAVKCLYREMGIAEEDIIPIPRYDMADYDGEECVCIVNSASNYEELAYDSHFMPPSSKIHALPISLHIHRYIPEDELEFYKKCGGVGCRDIKTVEYLRNLNVDAYLSGCLTLTFPRRNPEKEINAKSVYFIDVPEELEHWIPDQLKQDAIRLTNIERFNNPGSTTRMSTQDAMEEHRRGEQRIDLLRDTAKLVVTSKLHIASPCVAMGIPVILAKEHFGDRFGFIDRLLPCYEKEHYREIDWDPQPINIEDIKEKIKNLVFARVRAAAEQCALKDAWEKRIPIYKISYEVGIKSILKTISFPKSNFKYAVWGIVLSTAYYLDEVMKSEYKEAELICGIDIAATGTYCQAPIIKPDQVKNLDKDVIVFVAAPSAHIMAKDMLNAQKRSFILLKESKAESYNL